MQQGGMETYVDDSGSLRLKGMEIVYPIVVGTVAFPLGKKAPGDVTHRWTCYVRGVNNEDLRHIIPRVQFDLHQTFAVPTRVLEQQPYEVTEQGWGEFEIGVHLYFTADAGVTDALVYHKLRLYDDGEQAGNMRGQDPKRPLVKETYEELVFWEPRLELYSRLQHHQPVPLHPPSTLLPYFKNVTEQEELAFLQECRAIIANKAAELHRELPPAVTQHLGGGAAPALPPGQGAGAPAAAGVMGGGLAPQNMAMAAAGGGAGAGMHPAGGAYPGMAQGGMPQGMQAAGMMMPPGMPHHM